MTSSVNLKQEVFREIDKLPDAQLSRVWQFIHSSQQSNEETIFDPISDWIGRGKLGKLARNIV
jgi:mRNA-degrading endonuclease RelE of RelBE toxin-antitoxin system